MRMLLACILATAVPVVVSAQQPQFLQVDPQSTRPFSPVVRVGNMLYLAGQIATGKDGKVVPGGIAPETKQVMENIKQVLEKAGSDLDHVVKCTVFLADMKEWDAMNEVYRTYFQKGRYPARSAFGATGLALDARTEIECIAVVK
ncbi:MAG: RidA family protein [Gemmatimonadales bacterium]